MASRAVLGWRRGVSKRSYVLVLAVSVAGLAVCAGLAISGGVPAGDLVGMGRGVDPGPHRVSGFVVALEGEGPSGTVLSVVHGSRPDRVCGAASPGGPSCRPPGASRRSASRGRTSRSRMR